MQRSKVSKTGRGLLQTSSDAASPAPKVDRGYVSGSAGVATILAQAACALT